MSDFKSTGALRLPGASTPLHPGPRALRPELRGVGLRAGQARVVHVHALRDDLHLRDQLRSVVGLVPAPAPLVRRGPIWITP